MPTPVIHLCVAEKLLNILEIGDKPSFFLGSIAPDSTHTSNIYEDISVNDEKYVAAHLTNSDINVWKNNVKEFINSNHTDRRFDFYLGWAVHILTDIYWEESLYKAFKIECLKADIFKDEMCDFFYRDIALLEESFCKQLKKTSNIPVYLNDSVVPTKYTTELEGWRESILNLFNTHSEHIGIIKYFTISSVSSFIINATTEISRFIGDVKRFKKKNASKKINHEMEIALVEYFETTCVGAENVVSSKFLEKRFSVSGESLRKMVNRLRSTGNPICSDRTGYWYAATDDELKATILQLRNRIQGILNAVAGLETHLLTTSDEPFEE